MSQKVDFEGKEKDQVDIHCELEVPFSGSLSPLETVYHLHAKDDFPDGGLRAWLVVLGCSCSVFATFGYVNSFGVFQEHYENVLLKGTAPYKIAWIGSTQSALVYFPALISGRLFDIGYLRLPLLIASFLLCQGFGVGVSCGILYGPVISIVAHWFKGRVSTAFGIISFSASIGGTVFPIAFRNLNATIGFKWSMRIIAFILMFVLGIMNLTVRRRLPPIVAAGGLFNLKQFKSPAYSVYTASNFVAWLGLYTVLTFIGVSAPSQGVSRHLSSYLVAIANASSGIGRLSCGFIADRIGSLNVMAPSVFLAGILTFLWPHVHGAVAHILLAVLYGAAVGGFVALTGSPMVAFGDSTDVGRRAGMSLTILSLGSLMGPPISGAINRATDGYSVVGIYAGSAIMAAVVLLVLCRYLVGGKV